MPPRSRSIQDDLFGEVIHIKPEDRPREKVLASLTIRKAKGLTMNYVKIGLDLLIQALNYFPGWKTKVGAVLQLIGTLLVFFNSYLTALAGFEIPQDIVIAVNAAAATLVAVGAANQPGNIKQD
jgi:hypothetical protein